MKQKKVYDSPPKHIYQVEKGAHFIVWSRYDMRWSSDTAKCTR